MSAQRNVLEVSAPTKEEAIANGLDQLGLTRDDVWIEVLEAGSRGLLGFGNREAIIRLIVKPLEAKPPPKPGVAPEAMPVGPVVEELQPEKDAAIQAPGVEVKGPPEISGGPDEDYVLSVARETVVELLDKMRVQATVTAKSFQEGEVGRRPTIQVEVTGDDLSILIGRQAETLGALQFITRLIVGKELGRSVSLQVDVEGYRKRRNRQLRRLARLMAEQAINTGRRQVLEPMPPDERRIVHIELRGHPDVYTESVGTGPRRKVTILPTN